MDYNPLTENLAIYLPEQKRLTIRRAIHGILLLLVLISPLLANLIQPYVAPTDVTVYWIINNYSEVMAIILCYALLFFPFWIRNLTCKCREYSVGEHRILVYAGHSHFYIKVDGAKYDESVRFALFTPTVLRTTLNDGSVLEATITPTFKRIKFKVNDRLF